MSSKILFLMAVVCLLVGFGRSDVVQDAIDSAGDAYADTKDYINDLTNGNDDTDYYGDSSSNYGMTRCLDCTIEKSMDNVPLSYRDETLHKYTSGCKEYECKQSSQNWCLVSYYRMRAFNGEAERKLERHECGNKNQRDQDLRCKTLRIDDEDDVIERCETKRSGAYTIYTSTLPLLASVVFLLLNH